MIEKKIKLSNFIVMFLRDFEPEDLFIDEMASLAMDLHTIQKGETPVLFPSITIVSWEEEGVVVKERTVKDLLNKDMKRDKVEKVLSRLYGLHQNYINKFTDDVTEALIEVYSDGEET